MPQHASAYLLLLRAPLRVRQHRQQRHLEHQHPQLFRLEEPHPRQFLYFCTSNASKHQHPQLFRLEEPHPRQFLYFFY